MMNQSFRVKILRSFILASSLEPFAAKPGCTTRHLDSSLGTKLEYFMISAANSISPLLELVDKVLIQKKQPNCVFDAGYYAQLASTKNRGGGKVNYGQILMLLPIIVGQCLLYVEEREDYGHIELFDRIYKAMGETTVEDVAWLQKLVDLSTELSATHNQRIGKIRHQLRPQFAGNTILEAIHADQFAHTMMATEIRDSYPICKRVYQELLTSPGEGLIAKSEHIFKKFLPELIRPDITADCISVAFYLAIFFHDDEVLFP